MKTRSKVKVSYDRDADVLTIESNDSATIDHAQEMGPLVVHFGKQNEPVLIEVLEASKTLRGQTKPFEQVAMLAR